MLIEVLRFFAVVAVAIVVGNLVAKIKLPAILGWLIAGIVFGPYLAQIVTLEITEALWFQIVAKVFECFAGVMIGHEIVFKKIARSGKQIIGITLIQSIGTFLFVSLAFAVTFLIAKIPVYPAFVFGGIALATAPAPVLSIVNEYKTNGPVTRTLIPLAAIDDVIGVVIFFTTISVIGSVKGGASASVLATAGMIVFPFAIGIAIGAAAGAILRKVKNRVVCFVLLLVGLLCSLGAGLCVDFLVFGSFRLNYLSKKRS